MQRQAARLVHTLAIVVAVAVLVPAAATAGRWGPGTSSRATTPPTAVHAAFGTCHQYCSSPSERARTKHVGAWTAINLRPRVVTVAARRGFSWSDAAIGFGTACGLALVAFGALAYRRHGAVDEIGELA
jgi:hypothetical protein